MTGDGSEPVNDGADGVDAVVDEELHRSGAELRSSASPVDPSQVIVGSLKRQMRTSRRLNAALVGLSALLIVALAGSLIGVFRDGDGDNGGGRRSTTAHTSAAIRLVDSLPPEPIDPHKVKLIAAVSRYDSCDRLVDELHRVGAEHVGSRGFGNLGSVMPYFEGYAVNRGRLGAASDSSLAFTDGDQGAAGMAANGATAGETLGTNVIVEGVDEPDSVKATGTLVVDLWGTKLRVTDTRAKSVVGTLELTPPGQKGSSEEPMVPSGSPRSRQIYSYPSSLLVEDRRAVVFGNESVPAPPLPDDPSAARPPHNYLTITFVDLTDPAKPALLDRVRVEGGLVAARRVGDKVRVVTDSSLAELPMVLPTSPNSVAAALRQNRLAVAESSAQDWIPDWDHGEKTASSPLVGCEDVVVPDTFAGVQMTSLVQFDMAGPFEPRAMSILAPSEDLTANATDVVVSSHVWVDPAKQKDDFSDWETALHRFSFTDDGPTYIGSGAVPGSVRDEFSLSVLDSKTVGVVTVDMVPWEDREKAKVTVRLMESDPVRHELGEVGALQPAGSGGDVGGVRFIGDRLLVSSGLFRTNLSVTDLSNRRAPVDLGSVGLGSQGDYVHPIGDNRVLVMATSYTTVDKSAYQGVRVALVDLSAAPKIITDWNQTLASSQASYDHHAFTWWPSRSLAAFGIQRNSRSLASIAPEAAFLSVNSDSIGAKLVRPIDADLGRPKCRWGEEDWTKCDPSGPPYVERVLVVDGSPWLYTSESLEQLDPDSFASLTVVPLPPLM